MLYNQCGIVLVGDNVNSYITGRGQLHPLHYVHGQEMSKIHLQVLLFSWFEGFDSLAFAHCGMPPQGSHLLHP